MAQHSGQINAGFQPTRFCFPLKNAVDNNTLVYAHLANFKEDSCEAKVDRSEHEECPDFVCEYGVDDFLQIQMIR